MADRDVIVRELGLRDGLQNIDTFFPTHAKCEWIDRAVDAGIPAMQVCSFVPPKLLPQFADAGEVVAHALTKPGLHVSALIPNVKGAARGFEAGVHMLSYVISVSEGHNLRNVRRSVDESMADFEAVVAMRSENGAWKDIKLSGGVSTALGCSIEGDIDPKAVMKLAERYLAAGADELTVADTVGYGNPAQAKRLFTDLLALAGDVPVSAHFHDTRGMGIANVFAAVEAGVRTFDGCLAGLGGCPFAPGATGNVVTEDVVFLLEDLGLRTGIDLDKLIATRELLYEHLPNEPLHGAAARALAARTEEGAPA